MRIHATALAMVASKSFANRRQRPSQAKVRSTTQRRGRTSKPLALSQRLMTSIVQRPRSLSARRSVVRGRPIRFGAGMNGAISAHSAFVMSLGYRMHSRLYCGRVISVQGIVTSILCPINDGTTTH